MKWFTIISHRGLPLQDPAQLEVARNALQKHLADAGAPSAMHAAQAAFKQEGEQDDLPSEEGEWAEAWRCAHEPVAKALHLDARYVEVELQREGSTRKPKAEWSPR